MTKLFLIAFAEIISFMILSFFLTILSDGTGTDFTINFFVMIICAIYIKVSVKKEDL